MPGDGRNPPQRGTLMGHLGWPTGAASRPSPGCLVILTPTVSQRKLFSRQPGGGHEKDGQTRPMLGFLADRQARRALRHGRLEEAHRLLAPPGGPANERAAGLIRQLARAYAERGE